MMFPISRVVEETSLSRRTIYRYVKEGLFPPPVKLGPNRVAWPSESIEAWRQERVQ
ncbi:helix-turn-helix transcriptional regulator [Sphingopyxis flava]|uniref:Transcriptional regulator, AlpA family n=1 Tax=Sphingopyxis flava TaxID=1507287 RepID=A0A1T5CVG1_9SPHN|nr:AlpA family phage regulatory protein [Sphingopyxis flava]SKB63485.1 transcriptional regulator, AlpA family [Sphingopyxis flava]